MQHLPFNWTQKVNGVPIALDLVKWRERAGDRHLAGMAHDGKRRAPRRETYALTRLKRLPNCKRFWIRFH